MPKAEVGSTRYLNNQLKSKGLQRLRWYCQVCQRQMRDQNGFKQHTMSESHVRQMILVGENSSKHISEYSTQFQRDFLQLLRTSHGEKNINLNHFYQEFIRDKEHIHMNATRWQSLTEFGKYLGREGICRVEEGEKGLEIAWIDNSPGTLRRQDAIRKKERQDKGDEQREQKLIADQVERAKRDAGLKQDDEDGSRLRQLQRDEGGKIKLNLEFKPARVSETQELSSSIMKTGSDKQEATSATLADPQGLFQDHSLDQLKAPEKASLKLGMSIAKTKNVFGSTSRKNTFGLAKPSVVKAERKAISEAERIMKEEIGRKNLREHSSNRGPPLKKMRIS